MSNKSNNPPEPNVRSYLGLSTEEVDFPCAHELQRRIDKFKTAISDAQRDVGRVETEVDYQEDIDCSECGNYERVEGKIEVDGISDAVKAIDDVEWDSSLLDELYELLDRAEAIERDRNDLYSMLESRLTEDELRELDEEIIQHRLKYGK